MPNSDTAQFSFAAVDASRWPDLEKLFDGRGGPKYCWCMLWRKRNREDRIGRGAAKNAVLKSKLKSYVENCVPIGILAYSGSEPVAWCSVGPRDSYRSLGSPVTQNENPGDVWSLVCFFVRRDCRRSGLSLRMIEEAKRYASANNAKVLEAYPVEPDSPSYKFMGLTGSFERAGFYACGRAGKRRVVMRYDL